MSKRYSKPAVNIVIETEGDLVNLICFSITVDSSIESDLHSNFLKE